MSGQPVDASNLPQQGDRELRERYRRLVELAPDGILIHDGERIVTANAAAVRLAGAATIADLVGHPIDTFLGPPYLKGVEAHLIRDPQRRPATETVRDTFRRLDGSEVAVEVTAIPFLEGGRPAAHLVVRDITDRLAAEAGQMEREKLTAVRKLAGGVAPRSTT